MHEHMREKKILKIGIHNRRYAYSYDSWISYFTLQFRCGAIINHAASVSWSLREAVWSGAQFNLLKTLLNILLRFLLSFTRCPTVLQNFNRNFNRLFNRVFNIQLNLAPVRRMVNVFLAAALRRSLPLFAHPLSWPSHLCVQKSRERKSERVELPNERSDDGAN